MIEFKAECGHTVRAKDEEVGDVVRCSYCGQDATVPQTIRDNLDFLFRDAEPIDAETAKPKRSWIFSKRNSSTKRPPIDPFLLIFRMCYAALLICIIIYVSRAYVLPMWREDRADKPAIAQNAVEQPLLVEETKRVVIQHRYGLIATKPYGVYVASTPPGAEVHFLPVEDAPDQGRYHLIKGARSSRANQAWVRMEDGEYVVEVVFPWNHPGLSNPSLPFHEEYRQFRRSIENASDLEREQLLEDFFLPDEAQSVFIDQTEKQLFIVRQYHHVVVQNGKSEGLRALFLPSIKLAGQTGYALDTLLKYYVPDERNYVYDNTLVMTELAYYNVPVEDQSIIAHALSQIGLIPYLTATGLTRLFEIGLHDGSFMTRVIREPVP